MVLAYLSSAPKPSLKSFHFDLHFTVGSPAPRWQDLIPTTTTAACPQPHSRILDITRLTMSALRNPDPDLAYGDLPPQRWDREKFERYSRGGGYDEREYRFQERDRLGGGRERRYVDLDVTERTAPPRVEERERFLVEERFPPTARRRAEFREEPIQSEVAVKTALTPYRGQSIVEREVDVTVPRPRSQIIRRQSSLDTFDRRPLPRYEDRYNIPADVPAPLPIRRLRSPPRERERERDRYREREFEEIRYRDLEPQSFEEYEDIRIRREKSSGPQRRRSAGKSVASTSSSGFEEVETVEKKKIKVEIGKRGKTRMPKRLAHKKAIIDLGLPFEEEVRKSPA